MGENSQIEWTDHTFNPWHGCTKVSQGCKHCYAETLSLRWGRDNLWGPQGERKRTSDANWREPIKWNKQAAAEGRRRRVFCASMADIFEDRPELDDWRMELWDVIEETPHLDWLLLTKRPEYVLGMMKRWTYTVQGIPKNIWIGTSVENQKAADERIPALLEIPATVLFLSVEPLLGAVNLAEYLGPNAAWGGVDWVIVGGESGPGARFMHPDWARSIRDQCQEAGVPFFFKQWGGVNKKSTGRVLDGLEWDEMPIGQGA